MEISPRVTANPCSMRPQKTRPTVRWALRGRFIAISWSEKEAGGGNTAGCSESESRSGCKPVARGNAPRAITLPQQKVRQGANPGFLLLVAHHPPWQRQPPQWFNRREQGRWAAITATRSSQARHHPGSRSSLPSSQLSDTASLQGSRPLNRTLRLHILGLTQHCCRPNLQREQLSHSRWFPGDATPPDRRPFRFR